MCALQIRSGALFFGQCGRCRSMFEVSKERSILFLHFVYLIFTAFLKICVTIAYWMIADIRNIRA